MKLGSIQPQEPQEGSFLALQGTPEALKRREALKGRAKPSGA